MQCLLGGGGGLDAVEGQREAGLVAVAGILVEDALGDGLIDGGKRGLQQIAGGGSVAGSDRGAQLLHEGADASAVGAVHTGALTRLRRTLENRLFLLLDFGTLTLGHLMLLLCIAQTSNVKRGKALCQTS